MTALWIILGVLAAVIAIIVILLHFSIKAYVTADKKSLSVTVKYLGIKVYGINLPDSGKTDDEPVKDDADDGGGEDTPNPSRLPKVRRIRRTLMNPKKPIPRRLPKRPRRPSRRKTAKSRMNRSRRFCSSSTSIKNTFRPEKRRSESS